MAAARSGFGPLRGRVVAHRHARGRLVVAMILIAAACAPAAPSPPGPEHPSVPEAAPGTEPVPVSRPGGPAQGGGPVPLDGDTSGAHHTGPGVPAAATSRVELDAYRAVHVSFCGWSEPVLRDPLLELVADTPVNAIQLDLKDESGQIGYASRVPLAAESGALDAACTYDLEEAVETLHGLGIPVIGRIVAFADPVLTTWAWDNGHTDWVIQDLDGEPYTGWYQGFTNPAHPEIVAYNIDLATEAAALGVDHVLWDYVRRPEGAIDAMSFVGMGASVEDAIAEFVREADEALEPYGVQHGASVYGISATRPTEIGQDIPAMAAHLDYVAPMVYPTHWGPGEFGYADPAREPYEITRAAVETFTTAVDGTRARVVPWLEDSDYRAWDRDIQLREQIRATHDLGIDEWLLWDPSVRYTREALLAGDDAHGGGDEDGEHDG